MIASFGVKQPVEAPTVSVVIPCYKVTEFVPAALDSLRRQTFRNFEVILVNDGCPDTEGLERALAPYFEEIVYIVQENRGVSVARNSAILASRAPLIALLDGDDVWEPNYLEVQLEYLEAHPEVDVVYPNAWFFGDTKAAGRLFTDFCPSHTEPSFVNVVAGRCHIFIGVVARKAAMMSAGLFDPALRSEDLDLWLRMLHAGSRFASHGIPLVRYRRRIGSFCTDGILLDDFTRRVYQKLLNLLDLSAEERNALTEAVDRVAASVDLATGKKALYDGNFEDALSRFIRANRVFNTVRLRVAITVLRVCPRLLHSYVHKRYPTEHSYLH